MRVAPVKGRRVAAYIDGDAGAVEEGGQDGGVAGEASGGCGGEQLPGVELADGYVAL